MRFSLLLAFGLLGACTQAPPVTHAEAIPATFADWVDTLPPVESMVGEPFRLDFEMDMNMLLSGMVDMEDTKSFPMGIKAGGNMTVSDHDHFRFEMSLDADFSGIPDAEIPGPIDFDLVMVSDGRKLFLVPSLREGWFRDQVLGVGIGFEHMVFTLKGELFSRLISLYLRAFEQSGMDMSVLLPEGMSFEEYLNQGMQPATWSHSLLMSTEVSDFSVDGDRVHIRARLKPELLKAMHFPAIDGQQAKLLEDMTYEATFDRRTGLPVELNYTSQMGEQVALDYHMTLANYVFGPEATSGIEFGYTLTPEQTEFPLDTWVQLMLTQMEAMVQEEDQDASF